MQNRFLVKYSVLRNSSNIFAEGLCPNLFPSVTRASCSLQSLNDSLWFFGRYTAVKRKFLLLRRMNLLSTEDHNSFFALTHRSKSQCLSRGKAFSMSLLRGDKISNNFTSPTKPLFEYFCRYALQSLTTNLCVCKTHRTTKKKIHSPGLNGLSLTL